MDIDSSGIADKVIPVTEPPAWTVITVAPLGEVADGYHWTPVQLPEYPFPATCTV